MAVILNISTVYDGVDLQPRQLGKYTKAAHQETGYRWQIDMLPRHFSSAARFVYGYRQRTPKYLFRKKQMAARRPDLVQSGGKLDLVYSGLMRRLMAQRHQVRAFPSRVTIMMRGPSYLRMRPHKSNHPHKAKELTTVTHEEQQTLSKIASDVFYRAILRSRKVRRQLTKAGHSV